MSKMKSHSGAKKRFKLKKSGLIKRRKAFGRHILTKKSSKRKRSLGRRSVVFKGEAKTITTLLGKN